MIKKLFSAAGLFMVLSIEKIFQHLITGILFAVQIESIGKPDIGQNIPVSDGNMALFNFVFTLLFVTGVILFIRGNNTGKRIIFWMAGLDILLEIIFHGIGYLTVSVLVSIAIIMLVLFNQNLKRSGQKS